ncbi:MAG: hypothetical protein A2032_05040 [Chloroflexi bacterium RBG_19FT_COMBO_49_13]|nr:MAG: hypothetical protein A2Y53_04015 [Chloroflexi bacterium RBG_16_47_49]OGO62170.1 MAG: hypothetical protein A2032_05040 [Chloroflexi bacterium RBG_19FT_COMBO_49_13]
MSIGAILIGIAMLVVAVPIVINPLLNNKLKDHTTGDREGLDSPVDRHTTLLLALRDLEFDHQIGKIAEEDYTGLRETMLAQAAIELEAQEKQDAELDAQLEQAIQLRREKQATSRVCNQCGGTLESSDRFCRACGTQVDKTCPKCGEKMQPNDLFCNNCGASLSTIKTPAPMEGA